MKKTILAALFISLGFGAFAQKLAHVDRQAILLQMPAMKGVQANMETAKKSFEGEYVIMQKEHDDKVVDYETKTKMAVSAGGWPEAIRQSKAQAIADLEQNMMDFQQTANDELQQEQDRLLKPLVEEFDAAVAKIAKAGGYTYVFDIGAGNLVYSGGEDIGDKLKVELKIPVTAPTSPTQK
ncbi:MAG: OmpH family outer membrane protein [Flavobacteriales bacterium]|nr:OmpH family outer membrane protein [Flavobacteriales bacterium]